ncbi:hypothetical protein [Nocardia crassostreae]|nr:hypothetical protein [Nocardia crassostreae]
MDGQLVDGGAIVRTVQDAANTTDTAVGRDMQDKLLGIDLGDLQCP